jgi:ribosome-binding protein aMBF1 (putative translation factor)
MVRPADRRANRRADTSIRLANNRRKPVLDKTLSNANNVNMVKKTKRPTLTEQVRRAIADSGITRYRIAQETGIAESTLCKFMAGERGFTLASLDKLADFLGLDIVARSSTRKAK